MREWHRILRAALGGGVYRPDRTGVGTLSLFGEQLVFDNRSGTTADVFPAVTTKRLAVGQVAAELASFLMGHDNLSGFHAEGCTIWDGNGKSDYWLPRARSEGDLGRIYGTQWRDWRSVGPSSPPLERLPDVAAVRHTDQLRTLVESLRKDPYGRRHLVTAWNPGELDDVCLPPCHVLFQCYVRPGATSMSVLDMRVDMRSVDLFLGLPFDVASYAMLQRLLALQTGMATGRLVFQLGDAHVYLNHLEAVGIVLSREPFEPPSLALNPFATLDNFALGDARLTNYRFHPAVPAPLNI